MYNEIHDKTIYWAAERGILKNGKVTTQMLKLGSEFGELGLNLAENNTIKDDIGDCLVVCTNLAQLSGFDLLVDIMTIEPTIHTTPSFPTAASYLGDMQDASIKHLNFSVAMRNFIHQLEGIALIRHTTLLECWEIAYNDIKDRKGVLTEEGAFIKESDPAYSEAAKRINNV